MTRRAPANLVAHIARCAFPRTLVGPVSPAGTNQDKVASRLAPKGSTWDVRDKTTISACLARRTVSDARRRGHAKNVLQGIIK
jgi:hypothetical protein